MKHRVIAMAVGGALVGFLSVGAISLASAQTTTTTTPPTTAPSTTAPGGGPHYGGSTADCPHMGGPSGSSNTTPNTSYQKTVSTDELPPGFSTARGRVRVTTLVAPLAPLAAACPSTP